MRCATVLAGVLLTATSMLPALAGATPEMPVILGSQPSSPGNQTQVLIWGTAPAGTVVKLWTGPSCFQHEADAPVAAASEFSSPGIRATVVSNTTTTFHATAHDLVDESYSACSTSSLTYVEDSDPPTVEIIGAPPEFNNDARPLFTFKASADATVACGIWLMGGEPTYGPCSDTTTYRPASPLPDGQTYWFGVMASDAAGNSARDSRYFYVDTRAPAVTITVPLSYLLSPDQATFDIWSDEYARFECSLDGKAWETCDIKGTRVTYAGLGEGEHSIAVRAIDPSGNVGTAMLIFRVPFPDPVLKPPGWTYPQTPPPVFIPPSNAFTIAGQARLPNARAILTVKLPGPGVLRMSDASSPAGRAAVAEARTLVRPRTTRITKAGSVRIKVIPTRAGRARLTKHGRLAVRVRLTFTPTGGTARSKTVSVVLRKKKAAR